MGTATAKVVVKPAVLQWARQTSGHTTGHVARALRVEEEVVRSWESTPTAVGYSQLQQLAALYKRPLTALLLPAPPEDFAYPTDFRVDVRGDRGRKVPPRIYELLRRTQYALDIVESVRPDTVTTALAVATIDDNPEIVASQERRRFDVDLSCQIKWGHMNGYREWRRLVQSLGVITCQYSLRNTGVRGFSLTGAGSTPAIVVSSSDSLTGRTFTLFHEYAHLVLRMGGLCDPPDGLVSVPEKVNYGHAFQLRVERWCNHFAGAFLLPREAIRQEDVEALRCTPDHETIMPIANKLGVSRLAFVTRLKVLNLIDEAIYWAWWHLLSQAVQHQPKKPSGLQIPPPKRALAENGARLSQIVLQAYDSGSITPLEASDALHLRVPQFPRLVDLLGTGTPEL